MSGSRLLNLMAKLFSYVGVPKLVRTHTCKALPSNEASSNEPSSSELFYETFTMMHNSSLVVNAIREKSLGSFLQRNPYIRIDNDTIKTISSILSCSSTEVTINIFTELRYLLEKIPKEHLNAYIAHLKTLEVSDTVDILAESIYTALQTLQWLQTPPEIKGVVQESQKSPAPPEIDALIISYILPVETVLDGSQKISFSFFKQPHIDAPSPPEIVDITGQEAGELAAS
ncbi:MAG: hypothetical protein COA94_04195 [Rickettsiales bacterium]|nr:MAG: hypothetical protein COA94_04195 [Rickettsiales bacterium]